MDSEFYPCAGWFYEFLENHWLCRVEEPTLEIDYRLSNRQVALDRPRQVEELCCDEFEDLIDIDVVSCTGEEQCSIHCPGIGSCLSKQGNHETYPLDFPKF